MAKFVSILGNIYNTKHIVKVYREDADQTILYIQQTGNITTSLSFSTVDVADNTLFEIEQALGIKEVI